jgi:actin-like ATPase involved in cell morphogenesis
MNGPMEPFLAIDFGTSKSAMAAWNPERRQARIIRNDEKEETTPSVVYFGPDEVLVGTRALEMLEDPEAQQWVIPSVKRDLVDDVPILLPDGREIEPVAIAAAIFRKLRDDAISLYFQEAVTRAVITCPAAFGEAQREKIEEAATRGGFEEVVLLDEPEAAAIAFVHEGFKVGSHVLVYDLGGGTFDLAVLASSGNGSFRRTLPSRGIAVCGGDDFDQVLYEHFDRTLGGKLSVDGARNLRALRRCRSIKERLSEREEIADSILLNGERTRLQITRAAFDALIRDRVEDTVGLTEQLVALAAAEGQAIETVVLVGGSSEIPLIHQRLKQVLPVPPQQWDLQNLAVVYGAACYGAEQAPWISVTPPGDPLEPLVERAREQMEAGNLEQALAIVESVLATRPDHAGATALAAELNRRIQERRRAEELAHLKEYEKLVKSVAKSLYETATLNALDRTVKMLGIDPLQAADIERRVVGETRDQIRRRIAGAGVVVKKPPAAVAPPLPKYAPIETWTSTEIRLLVSHGVAMHPCEPMVAVVARYPKWTTAAVSVLRLPNVTWVAYNSGIQNVYGLAFSPDGGSLGTDVPFGNTIVFRNASYFPAKGKADMVYKKSKPGSFLANLTDNSRINGALAFLNASQVYVAGPKKRIFLIDTGAVKQTVFATLLYQPRRLAIPPGKKILAAAGKRVELYDITTAKLIRTLDESERHQAGSEGPGTSLTCSADGRLIARGHPNGIACVWDVDSGALIRTVTVPVTAALPLSSASLSPDGRLLATSTGKSLVLWDVGTGAVHQEAPHAQNVTHAAFTFDGRYLVVVHGAPPAGKYLGELTIHERKPQPQG